MDSVRKKLDEKNLKILRELASLPPNKHCFDCGQRGPTYVNVTIGSFVCTTCSGILRGLTPPHRVKSISMATFSPEEVDLIRARGNEYCRRVWLGLCDTEEPTKDEQQIKDFMISKYEKKRYYIEPSEETKVAINGTISQPSSSPVLNKVNTIPRPSSLGTRNNKSDLNGSTGNLKLNSMTNNTQPSDPFSSPVSDNSSTTEDSLQSFANFDNNPIFNASATTATSVSGWDSLGDLRGLDMTPTNIQPDPRWSTTLPSQFPSWDACLPSSALPSNRWSYCGGTLAAVSSVVNQAPAAPSEDRYAALKDLDSLMKTQMANSDSQATIKSEWGSTGWTSPPLFNSTPQEPPNSVTKSSNPFTGENGWNESSTFYGNPFKTQRHISESGWPMSNGQMTNGFPTSQSLNFGPAKNLWNPEPVSNPFAVGLTSNGNSQGKAYHSSNPFL